MEGPNGTSRGAFEVFQTLAYPVKAKTSTSNNTTTNTNSTGNTVVQGATIPSTKSPIKLSIENRYKEIGKGDTIDYTVAYKNIGDSKLTNPMIQVIVPSGITITNATSGTYSTGDRTLSAPINDLNPGDEVTLNLQGFVNKIDSGSAQLVTTVILIYTNTDGAQENAMAFVLNSPKPVSQLGASAATATSSFSKFFSGVGLIGWLIIIIIVLLLIILIRKLLSRHPTRQTNIM